MHMGGRRLQGSWERLPQKVTLESAQSACGRHILVHLRTLTGEYGMPDMVWECDESHCLHSDEGALCQLNNYFLVSLCTGESQPTNRYGRLSVRGQAVYEDPQKREGTSF